jgi:hypothetical protein
VNCSHPSGAPGSQTHLRQFEKTRLLQLNDLRKDKSLLALRYYPWSSCKLGGIATF